MKVVVLHGAVAPNAPADEQDVLVEVDAVNGALESLGHSVSRLPFTMELPAVSSMLSGLEPELVFNLVESVDGKGRYIHLSPTLLDGLGIPYTGSHTEAVFTTSSKTLAKSIMRAAGIPTADWHTVTSLNGGQLKPGGRYIVKSVWEHASIGLDNDSVVEAASAEGLADAIRSRSTGPAGECFAEEYIEGREFNISVIEEEDGPRVLPPAEMRFVGFGPDRHRILDYASKWDEGSVQYASTIRSFEFTGDDAPLIAELTDISGRCWRLFGLNGYARVDFRVDGAGRPYVLEVNVNPCISPDAGFMAAAARAGLVMRSVVGRIVRAALTRTGRAGVAR